MFGWLRSLCCKKTEADIDELFDRQYQLSVKEKGELTPRIMRDKRSLNDDESGSQEVDREYGKDMSELNPWDSFKGYGTLEAAAANKSRMRAFIDYMAPNEVLKIGLALNFVRDVTWTAMSYLNWNIHGKASDDVGEQIFAQWLYSTAAMAVALLGIYGRYKYKDWQMPLKEACTSLVAASAAIYTWDKAQDIGIAFGLKHIKAKQRFVDAGYLAAIFTGGAEGPTQYIITLIGTLILLPEERTKYSLSRATKEFILNASIGIIPGGNWQIVYNWNPAKATSATAANNIPRLLTGSVAVGASVMFWNWTCAKAVERVMTIECCPPTTEVAGRQNPAYIL